MNAPPFQSRGEGAPASERSAPLFLRVRGVSKHFGSALALRAVDLDVGVGETLALFGPNGSGKTTLLRVLAGLVPPTRGSVEIAGLGYGRGAQAIRRRIGVVGHHTYLYDDLTAQENLLFYGRMYGLDRLDQRVTEALSLAGLERRGGDKVRAYSRGMQQRLALARATLHDPDLLLLDEPDTGLDQDAFARLNAFLERPRGHPRTIVMATHDLRLGQAHCNRFAILAQGHIVQEGFLKDIPLPELEAHYQQATAQNQEGAA